ncbi:hypothetical protein JYU34_007776 [Plutella xylostella]|uniref:Reverse transcriptase domain-containing protein n=1 Tax=Plutella xylostella TaxID=51655 RepID=A0ABQ7QR57_PLUXY|nr:hypothetical protein JYU34_007776 [Plutella xylostella]
MKDERLIEIENALKEVNWDIVGLSEIRRIGEETTERDNCIFYHYGTISGLYGVGFMVSKKWKNNILEFIGYSDRIAVLKFQISQKHTLTLIQTYAPTSSHTDDEVESYYDLLNKACDEHRGTWTMVLGDFNAKLGKRQELDNADTLGPHGLGCRNERGTRLLQFAFGQSLKVSNSFFYKKAQRRWTWVSPDSITKNEIDFILSSNQSIVKDVSVINKFNCSSDHRPLRARVSFDIKIHRKLLFTKQIKRLNKHILIQNADHFNLELSNSFKCLEIDIEDVDNQFNNIKKSIYDASKKVKQNRINDNKLTTETIALINERESYARCSPEYNHIDRIVKRSIRKDIRSYNTKLVQIAIEKHHSLRNAKMGANRAKTWINCLKDENGVKHSHRDNITTICTTFYKNLYSDANKNELPDIEYTCPDTIPPITGQEVYTALKSMKYDKSPGEDGITTEALKVGKNTLIPHITNLCNTILHKGQLPVKICHANIILLHKKGDKSDIGNYRPISLISHIYKIFIKIIENRISAKLDSHQPPEQAGFRPGFSTTDHLHTLNQIIEKHSEFNKPLYLGFVDYSKAFDSITHNSIFTALQNQDVDPTYIQILRKIYNNSTADIKLQNPGPLFKIEKGVKQGDPLSPKLFTATLEEVFKKLTLVAEC